MVRLNKPTHVSRGRKTGYIRVTVDGKRYYLHRLIVGAVPGYEVHHIDWNPENNDPSNLAVLTRAEHNQVHPRLGNQYTGQVGQSVWVG